MGKRNSKSYSFAEPEELPEDILDNGVQKNRITDLAPEKKSPRFLQFFKKKAFIFPFAAIVIFGVIATAAYYFRSGKRFLPANQGSTESIPKNSSLPELPPDSKELTEGKAYFLRGWYPAAESAFERVLNSDAPDKHKSIALTYLGIIAYDQGQYLRSIDFLERAIQYNSKDPIIYRNLANAYRQRGLNDKAIDAIQKAINLQKSDAFNYIVLGNLFFSLKDYGQAIRAYKQGLKYAPDDPLLLFNSALAHYQLGDEPAAVNHFHLAARKSHAGNVAVQSYLNLGKIYTLRKDWNKALEYLRQAHQLSPKDSDILYNLGNVQLSMGDKEGALASFQKALVTGSATAELYESLGDTFLKNELYKEGIAAYEKALQTESRGDRSNILIKIGELYYKAGDLKKAEEQYRKIIATAPGSAAARQAFLQLGNILDDIEQYQEAIDMYRKAAELDPGEEKAWINMAISYRKMGKFIEATEVYKKALQANPENIKARMGLANLYYEQRFFDEAMAEYLKITQAQPDYAPAHFSISQIYQSQEQMAEAVSGYQKVLDIANREKISMELVFKSHLNIALALNALIEKQKSQSRDQDYETAVRHAKTAIQMQPQNGHGYYVLGNIYLQRKEIGDVENSADIFRQILALPNQNQETLSKAHTGLGKSLFFLKNYSASVRSFSQALQLWPGNEEAALNRKTAILKYEQSLR